MAHKILEEIIGKNIARYREAAGLTQATLAEKIGISTAFVSRVERGSEENEGRNALCHSKGPQCKC